MDAPTQSAQSQSISPLRQRTLEDMRMRKLGEHTQSDYIRAVRRLAKYLGRSPDTATAEDLRNFQLHLVACPIGACASSPHRGSRAGIAQPLNATAVGITVMRTFYVRSVGKRR